MTSTAILCPWCSREVRVRPTDGVLFKHDNRNNSGFCKGSLMPAQDGFGNEWQNCHERCSQEVVRPGKVQCHGLYVPADTESGEYEDAVDEDGLTIFAPCPWGNTPHLEGQQNGS